MIYHYNRLTLKPGVSDAERDAAFANWHEQGRVIKAVESFSIGPDIGGGFEYAAVFVIRDVEGYKEYMSDPTHRQTDALGLPLVDKFVSYDLVDDPDPAVAEQIRRIHAERFAGDEELVKLIQGLGSYEGSSHPSGTNAPEGGKGQ